MFYLDTTYSTRSSRRSTLHQPKSVLGVPPSPALRTGIEHKRRCQQEAETLTRDRHTNAQNCFSPAAKHAIEVSCYGIPPALNSQNRQAIFNPAARRDIQSGKQKRLLAYLINRDTSQAELACEPVGIGASGDE
jgi:hypothetical protein